MAPLLIVGAILSVASAAIASKQQRAMANLAEEAGGIEADRTRREGRRSIAERAARFGASGVVVGTGSTLDVLADEAAEVEEAALIGAFAGDVRASNLRAQAGQTLASGIIGAIGTIGAVGVGLGGETSAPLGTSPITVPSPLIGPPA